MNEILKKIYGEPKDITEDELRTMEKIREGFMANIDVQEHFNGKRVEITFNNGYGLSCVNSPLITNMYGGWEMTLLNGGNLCYDDNRFTDVIRGLEANDIWDLCIEVSKFKTKGR